MKNQWILRLTCDDLVIDRAFESEKAAKLKAGKWNEKWNSKWSFELYNPGFELVATARDRSYRLTWKRSDGNGEKENHKADSENTR